MSTNSERALDSCAATLGVQLNCIGRVLDVRWVTSFYDRHCCLEMIHSVTLALHEMHCR